MNDCLHHQRLYFLRETGRREAMNQFCRVAYLFDPNNKDVEAAKQALSQVRNNKGSLLVWVAQSPLPDAVSVYSDALETGLLAQAHSHIAKSSQEIGLDMHSISVEFQFFECAKPAEELAQRVAEQNIHLLVKAADRTSKHSGFDANDLALLRKCACEVWLCRPISKHREEIKVGLAINALVVDDGATALNQQLLETAQNLAQQCDGKLNVFSCWEFEHEAILKNSVWLQVADETLDAYIDGAERKHASALNSLLGVPQGGASNDFNIYTAKGRAQDRLPEMVNSHSIDILVMGTMARSGIPGLLIGNTAENVIDRLSCSLLTVKPK